MAVKKASTARTKVADKNVVASAKSASLTNHICFVVDRSGSMSSIKRQVVRVFNDQLQTVQSNAKTAGQQTFFSTFMFHSTVDKPLHFTVPVESVPKLAAGDFNTGGSTALLDAVGTAITQLQKAKGAANKNTSFLVIVITDGEENRSRKFKKTLKGLIQKVQKTGRWSLAFLVPPGSENSMTVFGIPRGNVTSWAANAKGAKVMDEKLSAGLQTFYKARASGQKSVNTFFTTDMSKVDVKSLTGLKDLSKGFSAVEGGQGALHPRVRQHQAQGQPRAAQEAGRRVQGGPRLLRADQAGDGAAAEERGHHGQVHQGHLRRGSGAQGAGHARWQQRARQARQPPQLRHLRGEHLHQPQAGARHHPALPALSRREPSPLLLS